MNCKDDFSELKKDGEEMVAGTDSKEKEIYIDAVVQSHGVCVYPDMEDVERLIEDNEPIAKQLYRELFPEGFENCFIGRCTLSFEKEDGDECCIEIESSLTKPVSCLYCTDESIPLSQVEIVEDGAKIDPLTAGDWEDGVPVEYAQEEERLSGSFTIQGKFDPHKLTLVVEKGFLVAIKYCGREVVSVSGDGEPLCDMYSIDYRYLDNGCIYGDKQEIMI